MFLLSTSGGAVPGSVPRHDDLLGARRVADSRGRQALRLHLRRNALERWKYILKDNPTLQGAKERQANSQCWRLGALEAEQRFEVDRIKD